MSNLPTEPTRVLHSPEADRDRFLPEGPRSVIVAGRPALAWVNIQTGEDAKSGSIHLRFWDTGEHRELPQPHRPGFLLPTDRPDTLFVGQGKEVGLVDLATNAWEPLGRIPDESDRVLINDGECVPGGRAVLFGTKDVEFSDPIARVYLFTLADHKIHTLAEGAVCSNGKVFRPGGISGILLFEIDTPRRVITRHELDPESAVLGDGSVAVDLHEIDGMPDGMVDCGDGTVIVAMYNPEPVPAGRAVRFELAGGAPIDAWETPGSPRVTCPLLAPVDGTVKLVLTTATEDMSPEDRAKCPEAGSLFVADTTFTDVPPAEVVRLPS